MLIGGRVRQRVLLHSICGQLPAHLRNNERDRFLALDLVLDRYDSRLQNVRMALQHALDVAGIDVLASRYEHVVGAPHKKMKAVGVAAEDIAGPIESVRRETGGKQGP